jgi:CRP-like cAMP-binding protein
VAHSPQQGSTVRNHLLAALSPEILSPLLPKFSSVDLPVRQVLHAPEAPIEAVYFPQTGMVPLVAGMEEGGRARRVGVIGRKGMVGLPLVMGVEDAFIEAAEDKLAAPARLLRDPALLAAHRGTR